MHSRTIQNHYIFRFSHSVVMIPKAILGIDSNIAANECFWMYFWMLLGVLQADLNDKQLAPPFFFNFLQKLASLIEMII